MSIDGSLCDHAPLLAHRFLTDNPILPSPSHKSSFLLSMAHPSSGWPPRNWLLRKSPAVADGAQLRRYWNLGVAAAQSSTSRAWRRTRGSHRRSLLLLLSALKGASHASPETTLAPPPHGRQKAERRQGLRPSRTQSETRDSGGGV